MFEQLTSLFFCFGVGWPGRQVSGTFPHSLQEHLASRRWCTPATAPIAASSSAWASRTAAAVGARRSPAAGGTGRGAWKNGTLAFCGKET